MSSEPPDTESSGGEYPLLSHKEDAPTGVLSGKEEQPSPACQARGGDTPPSQGGDTEEQPLPPRQAQGGDPLPSQGGDASPKDTRPHSPRVQLTTDKKPKCKRKVEETLTLTQNADP